MMVMVQVMISAEEPPVGWISLFWPCPRVQLRVHTSATAILQCVRAVESVSALTGT